MRETCSHQDWYRSVLSSTDGYPIIPIEIRKKCAGCGIDMGECGTSPVTDHMYEADGG
jgi:hypothetical protein